MVQNNPPRKKPSGNRNLKLLFTTLSVTTTLSGWAILSLNQAATTTDQAAANIQATPAAQDTSAATAQPTAVPPTSVPPTQKPAPTDPPVQVQVVLPALSSLPYRSAPSANNNAQQVITVQSPLAQNVPLPPPGLPGGGGNGGGGNGGGNAPVAVNNGGANNAGGNGGGSQVKAPPPAPKPVPPPKPPPVTKSKGSHP